jgi:hypothetical protein
MCARRSRSLPSGNVPSSNSSPAGNPTSRSPARWGSRPRDGQDARETDFHQAVRRNPRPGGCSGAEPRIPRHRADVLSGDRLQAAVGRCIRPHLWVRAAGAAAPTKFLDARPVWILRRHADCAACLHQENAEDPAGRSGDGPAKNEGAVVVSKEKNLHVGSSLTVAASRPSLRASSPTK